MNRLLFFSLLLKIFYSVAVLVRSDPSTTSLLSEVPRRLVGLSQYHNNLYKNFLGNDAKWIWSLSGKRFPDGYTEMFESIIKTSSEGTGILQISAESSFVAYMNGILVGQGSDAIKRFSFIVTLRNQSNILQIVVRKSGLPSYAGVVFSVFKLVNGRITYLFLSDYSNTVVVTPSIVRQQLRSARQPNFVGNDAEWVWESRLQAYAQGYVAVFEKSFTVLDIFGRFQLNIAADSQFTVLLNDEEIGEGRCVSIKYGFTVYPQTGTNLLRIIVLNREDNTPGALIFSFFQQIQDSINSILAVSDPSIKLLTNLVSYEEYYNFNFPDILGNGAIWIWDSRIGSHGDGFTACFQHTFKSSNFGTATLKIRADNQFIALINGYRIGGGDDWSQIYSFSINIKAGNNTFNVLAINKGADTPAGLIFSIEMDDKILAKSDSATTTLSAPVGLSLYHNSIYKNLIGNEAKWIRNSLPNTWKEGFSETFLTSFTNEFINLKAILVIISDSYYAAFLNEIFIGAGNSSIQKYSFSLNPRCGSNSLQLVVSNKYEGSAPSVAFYIEQDQKNTGCKCKDLQNCLYPRRLTQNCTCECQITCSVYEVLDKQNCQCLQCIQTSCDYGYYWSRDQCSCIFSCKQRTVCQNNQYYDIELCKCKCFSSYLRLCRATQAWSQNLCKCVKVLNRSGH